jgi:hypothetical protein
MNKPEFRSQENGKRTPRSKESSFTEMDVNIRVSYKMIIFMDKES